MCIRDRCDHCGGRLYQREDDRPEAITVRLEAYERSTAPLIQFYQDLGLLLPIVAKGSPGEIVARTMDKLDELAAQRGDGDDRRTTLHLAPKL